MSKIEVNAIEPQSGTTLTLGASGDTVTLAAGALQSGFGRTGTVNWDTTPKTSSPVTAVSGNGYFINTTSGAITVNLPATPAAGAIVAIADYANTAATNNITVGRNGSLIDGEAGDAKIKVNGQVYTLVYVDATEGWKTVNQTFNQISTADFITATGGTITTCGNFKIHTFTGPGTFTVSAIGNPAGSTTVDYMVIAGGGGGGGGSDGSGGGSGAGAGGFRQSFPNPATAGFPVSVTAYPITVGAGGNGGPNTGPNVNANGTAGNNSIFSTITSAGGGQGRGGPCASQAGAPGGSGGGASGGNPGCQPGGTGNTPPVSPSQGNNGGSGGAHPAPPSTIFTSAGGGGSGGAGGNAQPGPRQGGIGSANSITGSPVTYSRGGTGGTYEGATTPISPEPANSGNGGFGKSTGPFGSPAAPGANGGSGIVVIRYKFQ
jgi:hypothetical protein